MIVVDASAVVLGLLNDGAARRRLVADPIAAPHLVDAEVAHVLRTQARRGDIDATDAHRALQRWARVGVERFGIVGLLERVWQLRDNLTACDAASVALAEALDCALLTADGRLGRASGPTCPITFVRS